MDPYLFYYHICWAQTIEEYGKACPRCRAAIAQIGNSGL